MIRKARQGDIAACAKIYERILDSGAQIGWVKGVYPTEATAQSALERGDLFVLDDEGVIKASAVINKRQVDVYADGNWSADTPDDEVMVLHTLTVDPRFKGQGLGRSFVDFYETYARKDGCTTLRMDTNVVNETARKLYNRLGYREAGIVPCVFNGIPNVKLVLFEKVLIRHEH